MSQITHGDTELANVIALRQLLKVKKCSQSSAQHQEWISSCNNFSFEPHHLFLSLHGNSQSLCLSPSLSFRQPGCTCRSGTHSSRSRAGRMQAPHFSCGICILCRGVYKYELLWLTIYILVKEKTKTTQNNPHVLWNQFSYRRNPPKLGPQDTPGIVIVFLKMEWDDPRTTHPSISRANWKSRFLNSNLLSDIPGRNTKTYFHLKFMAP